MNSELPSASVLPTLDLEQDGIKFVTLTFGINLYTNTSFYDCPEAILGALDLFCERCPPNQMRWYATETMRAHKPITTRAQNMPSTWLKPGAPRKTYVALEFKSGEVYQDAPQFKYHIWDNEASKQAKVLSLAFPASWGIERTNDMLDLVKMLCEIFPFRSGLAGFAFERTHYAEEKSETHAWSMSMRHPGIDIVRLPVDAKAPNADGEDGATGEGIRGVGWLTMVSTDLLAQIGGVSSLRSRLDPQIDLIKTKYGMIIKAGPAPLLGDVNRGEKLLLYRQVYNVLAPLINIAAKRSMAFQLANDYSERTESWYARLGA